jgi:hypothetical protein
MIFKKFLLSAYNGYRIPLIAKVAYGRKFMNTQDFIAKIKDKSISNGKAYNLLPSVTIAQAAQESGWGGGLIFQKTNNLFGILANGWTTNIYKASNGLYYRVYSSLDASIDDRAAFLKQNTRYAAIFGQKDYKKACQILESSGYAGNSPNYAEQLITIIEQFNLTQYDTSVIQDPTVLTYQKKLNRLKVVSPALVEDGVLGTKTKSAIIAFEKIAGLTVDSGIWGSQCDGAYNTIVAKPTIQQGSSGIAVRYLQFRVGATIDGVFGSKTATALKTFQSKNSLTADGICGAKTWAVLIG